MRKRSSNQIKKILIGMAVLIVVMLIALIIFLLNVDIKSTDNLQNNTAVSTNTTNTTQNIISIEENDLSEYSIVVNDNENTFEIRLNGKKIYFDVIDDDNFSKKYSKSEVNTAKEIEVATHNYEIDNILIGICNNEEYLIALMKDGTLGIMNISEAIESNVFRIKNQLISIGNTKVVNISKGYKKSNDKQEDVIIVETDDGKKYDLADFVE